MSKLQTLSWKTTVTVIVNFRDSLIRIELLLSTRLFLGRPLSLLLSTSGTLLLELKYCYQLLTLFWKTTLTVSVITRDAPVRIEVLL